MSQPRECDRRLRQIVSRARKNALVEGAFAKRLMGLEPTTFCMASST
jgi:hypothetical protein